VKEVKEVKPPATKKTVTSPPPVSPPLRPTAAGGTDAANQPHPTTPTPTAHRPPLTPPQVAKGSPNYKGSPNPKGPKKEIDEPKQEVHPPQPHPHPHPHPPNH
jgi:hypothetical protein